MAVRIDELPGETIYLEVAPRPGVGRASGGQPGVRRRRAAVLHDERQPRHQGHGAALSHRRDGAREPIAVEIANPTSLARRTGRLLYVSSRFDGQVLSAAATTTVPRSMRRNWAWRPVSRLDRMAVCSSAIDPERSFASRPIATSRRSRRCRRASRRFIWRFGPDDCLYVTAPTLVDARRDLSHHAGSTGGRGLRRIRPSAGPGVRFDGRAVCRRRAGRQGRPVSARRVEATRRSPNSC